MEFFLLWFGLAVVTGIVAGSKGRSGFGWFLLALLISGLLALILVALLPSLKPTVVHVHDAGGRVDNGMMKSCPRCAEAVKAAARVCRYCGYEFALIEAPNASLFDQYVFIRPVKPAFSHRLKYEAVIHGTSRRFDTEEQAVAHVQRYRDQATHRIA